MENIRWFQGSDRVSPGEDLKETSRNHERTSALRTPSKR